MNRSTATESYVQRCGAPRSPSVKIAGAYRGPIQDVKLIVDSPRSKPSKSRPSANCSAAVPAKQPTAIVKPPKMEQSKSVAQMDLYDSRRLSVASDTLGATTSSQSSPQSRLRRSKSASAAINSDLGPDYEATHWARLHPPSNNTTFASPPQRSRATMRTFSHSLGKDAMVRDVPCNGSVCSPTLRSSSMSSMASPSMSKTMVMRTPRQHRERALASSPKFREESFIPRSIQHDGYRKDKVVEPSCNTSFDDSLSELDVFVKRDTEVHNTESNHDDDEASFSKQFQVVTSSREADADWKRRLALNISIRSLKAAPDAWTPHNSMSTLAFGIGSSAADGGPPLRVQSDPAVSPVVSASHTARQLNANAPCFPSIPSLHSSPRRVSSKMMLPTRPVVAEVSTPTVRPPTPPRPKNRLALTSQRARSQRNLTSATNSEPATKSNPSLCKSKHCNVPPRRNVSEMTQRDIFGDSVGDLSAFDDQSFSDIITWRRF